MQGLLIGIWLINNTIYCLHLTLGSSQYGCYWEYYAVKTGVVFISVIVYTIAACKYKYENVMNNLMLMRGYHYRIYQKTTRAEIFYRR